MKAQRLRFRYRLTPVAIEMRQRDIVDAWEAALKAAGLPLAYSEGKRANALISLAAPLPPGVTSDWELVDIFFEEPVVPGEALHRVQPHFPPGLDPVDVVEIGVGGPSLQGAMRWAEYEVTLPPTADRVQVAAGIQRVLAANTLPAEYRRETRVRESDLRPLILDICCIDCAASEPVTLRLKLRAEPENTARADQVIAALGLPAPVRVHRSRLQVEQTPAVLAAYRRLGRAQGKD